MEISIGAAEILVPAVCSFIGAIVWLIRLEGRINYLERTLTRLEEKHDEVMDKLSVIEKCLAKVEGLLSREKHVI